MRNRNYISSNGERNSIAIIAQGSDIWPGTATSLVIPPSAGEQMQIVCADSNDTFNGTGIQELDIHYLDGSGNSQITSISTNGGTKDIPIMDMKFIQELHASKVGNNNAAVGNIEIRSLNTLDVYNIILANYTTSMTINKMVPAGKTLYLTQWNATASGKTGATFYLKSTDHHNELFNSNNPIFIIKDTAALENSSFSKSWAIEEWIPIPELSIIKISVIAPDQAGADVSASWSGILIGNN